MLPEPLSNDPFALSGVTLGGKYRVDKLVGEGGFGVVYRGTHIAFDEPIAIKCLRVAEDLPEAERTMLLKKLRDEGAILHRLSKRTAAIVQALDVDATITPSGHWVPYLVLEWLEGETLAEHLYNREHRGEEAYPVRAAVSLLAPVFSGLAHAHRRKVAHRDVKPDNLFLEALDGPPSLKVLDFGIAKVLRGHASFTASPEATRERPTAFTPLYGAPEQFNKRLGASGPWTDVFALALVLVEMVTGRRALDGDNPTQLYVAATNPDARPTMRFHGIDPGDAVEAVLERALAIEPHDRYSDAGLFWEALSQAVQHSSSGEGPSASIEETHAFLENQALLDEVGKLSDPGLLEAVTVPQALGSGRGGREDDSSMAETLALALADTRKANAPAKSSSLDSAPSSPRDSATRVISDEPIAHFEVQVIDLARTGVPLTVSNVVAATGLTRENAVAWLNELSDRNELLREEHEGMGPLYHVPGLTVTPPAQGRLGRARAPIYRWLQIHPEIPPRIPAEARKSVPFGACFAGLVPFIGLLYAAPFWSAALITGGIAIALGLLGALPVVGRGLGYLTPVLWVTLHGVFGAAYTWHYNRHGKRTALRAVNYDGLTASTQPTSQTPPPTDSA